MKMYFDLQLEKLFQWIAWRLPKRLVYWCGICMISNASCMLPKKEMGKITIEDILKKWNEK